MSLTPEQRDEYAAELADGVPEEVIEEFDARLNKYMADWRHGIAEHVKKASTPKQ